MKNAPLPYVNLDVATARALPLAPVEARAQFRFCFRLPDGDEEWLLARLCAIQNYPSGQSRYGIVLRPENAESDRVFFCESAMYRSSLTATMRPDEAEDYDWDEFARQWNAAGANISHSLTRYEIVEAEGIRTNVQFWANGTAEVVGVFRMDVGGEQMKEGFNWDDGCPQVNGSFASMNMLRTSHVLFRQQIWNQWVAPKAQLKDAVLWAQFDESQRNAFIYRCENGSWAQLRELASSVLRVRIHSQQTQIEARYLWNLVDPGSVIEIGARQSNLSALSDDPALPIWRAALVKQFEPVNILRNESEDQSLPRYSYLYLAHHQQASIEVAAPTMHETLEAQLQLRDWAHAHFAPAEAARLLDILRSASE